ncbi:redox protein, regulator of disulfide bond formation [Halogeometricum pallidum JCM 14848]|uniref:Redox protein, regulator of disulfide bond formation n=1 Tax=Halogeometricum pallidum JCM 14848 TaxID=1227487 RepID=M0CUS9_HALPD|nr:OsmC family protein [Halogeometricum pallidum]ELZ26167.1 redox protein, regulator of disulfide bond formation [Halogeometricum pallidum JCM 14848]
MSDIETSTVSEEGFASTSQVGDFELTIDATGEEGPDPNQVLVADYASCFLPAFRVGANKTGHEDLGKVQIDADADIDDDDDLEAIRFSVHVEEDVDDDDLEEIVSRAEDICHVHSALREGLHAEIEAHGDAF